MYDIITICKLVACSNYSVLCSTVIHTTFNWFVSPGAKFEVEIDIMDTESKGDNSITRQPQLVNTIIV